MRKPESVRALEDLGRVRLSPSFFMRDFLYSETANFHGMPNIPDDPDLAITTGRKLCEEILEPLQARFGRISIRSGYRSPTVNKFCNEHGLNCASNEKNYAAHIWDHPTGTGVTGASATIVVNAFIGYYEATGRWQSLAWWIHDHLPYDEMTFFPKLAAFNVSWRTEPRRVIRSYVPPVRSDLTKPGMANHAGSHAAEYADFLANLPAPAATSPDVAWAPSDNSPASTIEPSASRTGLAKCGQSGERGRKMYPGRQRRNRVASASMPARKPFSRVTRITKFEQVSEKMQRSRKARGASR